MSNGDDPSGEQGYDTGQSFAAPPPYLAPPGSDQPGYGQPGYGPAGYRQSGYGTPGSAPPPTYRGWVTAAFICGVLFNIVLGFSTAFGAHRASDTAAQKWASGDVQGAIKASRWARGWLIASFTFDVLGIVLFVLTQK